MKVCDVMTRDVEIASSEMSLTEAARRMRVRDVGFLPVAANGTVVGVITDRDITLRGLGEGRIPELTKIGDVMTPMAVWCYEDDVLTHAAQTMEENRVRRLLVLDSTQKLVGLLSLDDLAEHLSSERLLGTVLRNVTARE